MYSVLKSVINYLIIKEFIFGEIVSGRQKLTLKVGFIVT